MSYEGFEQWVCKNGHLTCVDAIAQSYGMVEDKCGTCGEEIVFTNSVDQTNGHEWGYIDFKPLKLTDAVYETCKHCGHKTLKEEETYRVPIQDEVKTLRMYCETWQGAETKWLPCHSVVDAAEGELP
jgi:hypothetical protein